MFGRTVRPLWALALILRGLACAEEPVPSPEKLKQALKELAERCRQNDERIKVLSERIKENEKNAMALRMIAEEMAIRLETHEKGAAKEFEQRLQPDAMNRLLEPVAAASVGDWVSYVKTVTAPDGTKSESTYKLLVTAKDKGVVTLKTETVRDGKIESTEIAYKNAGPFDVFDEEGKQRRTRKDSVREIITVGLAKYACIKITYNVSLMDGEKAVFAGERVSWINFTVPLTGFAMAVHTAPNGEATTYALLDSGHK